MVRHDDIFRHVATFENVYKAFLECKKGKSYKNEVMRVAVRAEMVCSDLVQELLNGEYYPGKYYEFETRNEVKRRVIHAPLFRDRIVQHAICQIVEPLFEKKYIFDSYANRKGKGNHKAVKRVQEFLRRAGKGAYVLQGDYKKYYDTLDHEILKNELKRTIRDRELLEVWYRIIDSYNSDIGRGIPIGAPLSQLMANIALNPFDHFVKEGLRERYHVRLMDDFVIVSQDKDRLRRELADVRWFAETKMQQKLNRKTRIFPAKQGVDFGGYRIWDDHILPRKRNVKAAKKRFKMLSWLSRHGLCNSKMVEPRLQSFRGYMKHCDGKRTLESTLAWLVIAKEVRK